MEFSDGRGYAFDLTVNAFHDLQALDGERFVGMRVRSPRSTFLVPPRSVDEYALRGLLLHLRAMLDGLVEPCDPHGEDGFVPFPDLLLSVRRVPAPEHSIAFEVSVQDCGCIDEREFNHGALIPLTVGRQELSRELDDLEQSLRRSDAGRSSPPGL